MRFHTRIIRWMQGFWHGFLKGLINKTWKVVYSYLKQEGIEAAMEFIKKAESMKGLSGDGKFKAVYELMMDWSKKNGKVVPRDILNTAINTLVTSMKPRISIDS